MFSKTLTSLFDFILPRLCETCSTKLIGQEEIICSSCFNNFEAANRERIKIEFDRKFLNENLVSDFASAFVFHEESEIQKLIHSLKYDQKYLIGKYLGKVVANQLAEDINKWNADIIIPIPLHTLRKADRGFNQAEEIVKGLSKELGIKQNSKIIKRKRYTQTQTKLTLIERKQNIEDAFQLRQNNAIIDKKIILVDDVITTGATISECASLLLDAGAKNIFALSVAIAK